MSWWQFSVTCQAPELDCVESLLLDLGAVSISLSDAKEEPIYEPPPGASPIWQYSIVTGMFDSAIDHETLYQQLVAGLPAHLLTEVRRQELQDQDWEQAYKQHFQPIQCAPQLWIVPSWCEPPDPQATNIKLDPGMAFGTGTHPTTALCLAWLGEHDINQQRVIDYGCGSGILAIAACKLGAKQVVAVDIDKQALEASEWNSRANDIASDRIQISLPEQMDTRKADLLIANILAGPLIEFAPQFANLLNPGARILLSGILKTQLEEIQSAYRPYFDLDPAGFQGDWVRLSGIRNDD
jgi:ribosomal protein L11 methyltransferase